MTYISNDQIVAYSKLTLGEINWNKIVAFSSKAGSQTKRWLLARPDASAS